MNWIIVEGIMLQKTSILLITFAIFMAFFQPLHACRYTVREIGYADFGVNPYQLYFYYDSTTPENQVKTFRRVTYAALYDANVVVEMVNIQKDTASTGIDYLKTQKNFALPTTILVSPEGHFKNFKLPRQPDSFKEEIWNLIEKIVTSPLRQKLVPQLAKTYGVALLVEGIDPAQNNKAKQIAKKTIGEISRMMGQMPKTVDAPPILMQLPFEKRGTETVLLWSLGIDAKAETPQIVILYGRGRRMGPVLGGKHLTDTNLLNLLGLVGADCECGLDRSWLLGTMFPLRWPLDLRELLVNQLGFDVENPAVKSEMSQILSISQAGRNQQSNDRLFSYREGVIELEKKTTAPRVSFSELQSLNSDAGSETGFSPLQIAWGVVGLVFLFVIVAGGFFLLRAKRR